MGSQQSFPPFGTPIAGTQQPTQPWLNFFRQLGRMLVVKTTVGGVPSFADTLGSFQDSGVGAANGCLFLSPQAQPSSGVVGQLYMTAGGVLRVCTATGTPGTWIDVGAQT